MADAEVPVLIVGGSLVGMSTALLLGHHGVRALAVEHHRGTAIHPRAAQISQQLLDDRKRRHFEVNEASFPVLMRGPTTNERKKGAGSMVPYLRLISG